MINISREKLTSIIGSLAMIQVDYALAHPNLSARQVRQALLDVAMERRWEDMKGMDHDQRAEYNDEG